MSVDLALAGLNHRRAPLALRERFALDAQRKDALLQAARGRLPEQVLLCTCNRTEWIAAGAADISESFPDLLRLHLAIEPEILREHFYIYHGEEALHHLCRVAAGLDSMVTGETQILGQLKDAFESAITSGYAGAQLQRSYQRLLTVAKSVRHETAIGHGAVSVSSVAVQLAKQIFAHFDDKVVLLVGAGEMCELAAQAFTELGVTQIRVVNRDPARGQSLAQRFGGQYFPLTQLAEALTSADIVLSSTASPTPIITHGIVQQAMKLRHGRPLFLIDIAMPRDIEEAVASLAQVYLYNLDDLQRLVADNLRERAKEGEKAEQLLQVRLKEVLAGSGEEIGPLITSLRDRVNRLEHQELDKLFRRHPHWSEAERDQVERSVNLILNRVLHDPIISLRKGQPNGQRHLSAVFKEFFNL